VVAFQLLCPVGVILVVSSALHQMLAALGRPDVTLKYNIACAVLYPSSFFVAAWLFGTLGVCIVWLALTPVFVATLIHATRGITGIGLRDVVAAQLPVVTGVVFMTLCVLTVQWLQRDDPRVAARLTAAIVTGVAAYTAWMLVSARQTVLADVRGLWLQLRGQP
jgi:O-antigen/teichoic acid export membrane protein